MVVCVNSRNQNQLLKPHGYLDIVTGFHDLVTSKNPLLATFVPQNLKQKK